MTEIAHQLGTKTGQNFWLSFLARLDHWLSSVDEQSCQLGYLLGCCHQQELSTFPLLEPSCFSPSLSDSTRNLSGQYLSGSLGKCPRTLRKVHVHLRVSFTYWRNCKPRGNSSVQHCTGLGEKQHGKRETITLIFLMWFFSVLWSKGCASASPLCLGSSQRCSVYEQLLVILSVKETKVRNHPFCHIADVILPGKIKPFKKAESHN